MDEQTVERRSIEIPEGVEDYYTVTFWAETWEDYERLRGDLEDRSIGNSAGSRAVNLSASPHVSVHSPPGPVRGWFLSMKPADSTRTPARGQASKETLNVEHMDFAVAVVALAGGPEWLYADEIRGRLRGLFGIDLPSQQVVGKLSRMSLEDSPRFERVRVPWAREWRYRATPYAATEAENKMPNLRVRDRAPRPIHQEADRG